MAQDRWTAVDRYIDDRLVRADDVFDGVQKGAAAADLPAISFSASQGTLRHLLARLWARAGSSSSSPTTSAPERVSGIDG